MISGVLTRLKCRALYRYLKGRWVCLRWHIPVVRSLGGYGGLDHLGRRRRGYDGMWCVKCNNRWEQASRGERVSGAMMWHWGKRKQRPSFKEPNK